MKTTFLFLLSILLMFSCSSDSSLVSEIKAIEPECFKDAVEIALSAPPTTPRASIKKYNVSSEIFTGIVFEVNILNVPDGGGSFQTSDCNIICGTTSGLMGANNCDSEFLDNLEFIETVWEDPR